MWTVEYSELLEEWCVRLGNATFYAEDKSEAEKLAKRLNAYHEIIEHVATDGAEITPELVEAARKLEK